MRACTLTCTRNDVLAAGASYPAITVTVNVANNAPASVTNTANVSGGGQIITTTIQLRSTTVVRPDMTIAKSHSCNLLKARLGQLIHLPLPTLACGNQRHGNRPDTLPSGLTATG